MFILPKNQKKFIIVGAKKITLMGYFLLVDMVLGLIVPLRITSYNQRNYQ
jgi:hypothetical protein